MTKKENFTYKDETYNIFIFIAFNGVEVTAVVLKIYNSKLVEYYFGSWECVAYAQNRLFTCKLTFKEKYFAGQVPEGENNSIILDKVLNVKVFVDYAIIPDYDELLAKYNDTKTV